MAIESGTYSIRTAYVEPIPDNYVDISEVTVTADSMLEGRTSFDKNGNPITGTIPGVRLIAPTISVDESGLITSSVTQTEGYILGETRTSTEQLEVQSAKTVTPTTAEQTVVSSGKFTTGDIKVAAIPSNYEDVTAETNTYTSLTDELEAAINALPDAGTSGGGSGEDLTEVIAEQDALITELEGLIEINSPAHPFVDYGEGTMTKISSDVESIIIKRAFMHNKTLTTIDLPAATSIGDYAFYECTALTTVNLPAATSIGWNAFNGCTSLTTIDLPVVTSMDSNAFYGCTALTTLIIRSSTICSLGNTKAFESTPIASGTGYVYVPRALVNSYKSATNWSAYAAQIRAIEDYPDICGG